MWRILQKECETAINWFNTNNMTVNPYKFQSMIISSKKDLSQSVLTYSTSDNVIPPISRVLIGRHLIFCWLTSPTCCNLSRKCTPVKYKVRQKTGFQIVT